MLKQALTLILICCAAYSFAQTSFVNFSAGTAAYKGSLSSAYAAPGPMFNLGVVIAKNKRLNGNFQIGGGEISYGAYQAATNSASNRANTFFSTRFYSFSYQLRYNFFLYKRHIAYAAAGIGLLRYSPEDENGNKLINRPETRALGEEYSEVMTFLPLTATYQYKLPKQWRAGVSVGYLNLNGTHFDNIDQLGRRRDNLFTAQVILQIPLKSNTEEVKVGPVNSAPDFNQGIKENTPE